MQMEETDKQLIFRYLNGQVDALTDLVERYRRPLFGYIYKMTGNQADADDVYQEVWLRAVKKLSMFTNKNFLGWLMRIAHNHVIDRARKKKADVSLDKETDGGGAMIDIIPGKDNVSGEGIDSGEIGTKIREAVDRLPLEQKEVFIMRTESEMPFKEIAKIQKVSINTALARMQYALAALRPMLKEVYNEL